MKISAQQAQIILTGNHKFSQLGFSMLITRLKKLYANDPSPSTMQECLKEINTFLEKFQGIMGSDFTIISKL